ncbi:hypothetical protein EPA93_36500 [Ktedonosporobacter rubrisoli]|uniref:ABC transporter permease n=1 Tax=Ktedonosporobacter rubrisoli TaxID=2509675 RepID=A0A4P6K071_KTERU|nr:hypothetical protein [Ktedonosporobacter rubrisoli]QBD81183.1 hypothetical protein EPA93_36500 [Ktedonosporobacter rubrisoli]
MIWFTWRQYSVTAIIALALLALLMSSFIITGIYIRSAHPHLDLAGCQQAMTCLITQTPFSTLLASIFIPFTAWLPLLVGVFVGAPLIAREQEQRTHYFAWLQSVPRKRWLITRIGLLTLVTLLAFGLLTLLTTWWAQPLTRFPWDWFNIQGPVLPAYALCALTLGIAVGAFVRYTVPAMALTFVLFLALFMGLGKAYPYLLPPITTTYTLSNVNNAWGQPGDLVLYTGYADQQGHEIGEISTYCNVSMVNNSQYGTLVQQCSRARHIQWKVIYQPHARFWPLQWIHTAIQLALSGLLLLLTFWRLRQRRA